MTTQRTGWVDCASGVSGDMLLGACIGAGVAVETLQSTLDLLGLPERTRLQHTSVDRAGIAAERIEVLVEDTASARHLSDIVAILARAPEPIADRAVDAFRLLAAAEARMHGVSVEEIHFHEVGALDAIADVACAVAGLLALELTSIVCSPIAVGRGRVNAAHGSLPLPAPAALELARHVGIPLYGGPLDMELATPTGVAVMGAMATSYGDLPPGVPVAVGVGAGSRDPAGHPNVVRLVVSQTSDDAGQFTVAEANVDDLDPRLWPSVLAELLRAGARDAWLTPILMKKGRPAHTVSALVEAAHIGDVERVLFETTSTIGVRRHPVRRTALERETRRVEVLGGTVRVKVSRRGAFVLSATPEFDDVARLADELGLPVRPVLEEARARAQLRVQDA